MTTLAAGAAETNASAAPRSQAVGRILVARGFNSADQALINRLKGAAELYKRKPDEGVTDDLLAELCKATTTSDRQVDCHLVPDGRKLEEQIATLRVLSDSLKEGDTVSLDVTHGLRHLPMLALLAALYLRGLRPDVRVQGVWYGAFDLKRNDITPVINLEYLIRFGDWISTFGVFEHSRDFGVFADLLRKENFQEIPQTFSSAHPIWNA